jgi:hypothetical protein
MALVADLANCDGFAVESPDGCLGWVEETWLDHAGHPAAFAMRTADGRRALLLADSVRAVDADSQEVLVAAHPLLRGLDAPRVEVLDGEPTASWHSAGMVDAAATTAHALPGAPAIAAARAATTPFERPMWQVALLGLCFLAALIAFEIGLAFGVAYLVTGRLT